MVQKMQDEDCGFDWRARANSSIFHESNSTNSVHTSQRGIKNHCCDVFPMWMTCCMAIFRRELKPWILCCNNSWLAKRNTLLTDSVSPNKTKILVLESRRRTTLNERILPITFFLTHEKRKNVHRLTNGNRTAHANHASLRKVFMDEMAPSAPEATVPSRREQPKDRAAAQPRSPCHLAARTCTPSHGGAPRALAATRLLKTRWSQQTSGLRPRHPRPPT